MFSQRIAVRTALAAALTLGAASNAFAATGSATANITVTAAINTNCLINAGAVGFGTYDPLVANASSNLDQSGTFTVACTKGTVATIGLSNGSNFASGKRYLASGSNLLQYELYSDTGRTTVWNGTNTVSYTSTGKATATQTIYGRIPGGQDANTGTNYTDTIVATVNF